MEAKLSREMTILPSVCDWGVKLSIPDLFAQFMDIATLHAEQIGAGEAALEARGMYWITVKTKARILRRPAMMERVTLSTRPLLPEKVRAVREYRLEQDGELLAEGKTEWAVMDAATGRPRATAGVFPAELELGTEPSYPEPFARLDPDFSQAELVGKYRVRSTDIDLLGHMNNVAYLRAFLGLISVEEQKTMPQAGVEIIFRAPCFEGELLSVRRRITETGWELAALRPDGKPAVFLKLDR